jgi:anti-sigma factor RsiW
MAAADPPLGLFVPQPGCHDVLVLKHLYVDCECDVHTMLVIAAHIERCDECAEQLAQLRWLKAAVRRCGNAPESPSWL